MKRSASLLLSVSLVAASSLALAKTASLSGSNEIKGTVQRLLVNPEGDVDGFILDNGTQVNFPPHMSSQLTATVAAKDNVDVKGFKENDKVFKADSITNLKTSKTVVEAPPQRPEGGPGGPDGLGGPPPPPPGGPGEGPIAHRGLKQLTADGKIQSQIYGRRGEVNGVVLSDNSIVRFGPRIQGDSKAKFEIGQSLKASGFGTENSYGRAIEATQLSN